MFKCSQHSNADPPSPFARGSWSPPHHDLRDFRVPHPSACRCGGDLRPDVAHGSSVEASSLPRFDRAETLLTCTVALPRSMQRTLLLFPIEFYLGYFLSHLCYPDVMNHDVSILSCLQKLNLFHIVVTAICVLLALDICVVPREFVIPSRKMAKDSKSATECVVPDPHHVPALYENREFNELVNTTAGGLERWFKEEQTETSGWDKGDGSGETIGHGS